MSARPVLKLRRTEPTPEAAPPAAPVVALAPKAISPGETRWRAAQAARNAAMRDQAWVIWEPSALRPSRRHSSLESARTEQARLAALHPTKSFLIYEMRIVEHAPHGLP